MFYRKDERQRRWDEDQIMFAELAHQYPCCDVPTLAMCIECEERPEVCANKKELHDLKCPGCGGAMWTACCDYCGDPLFGKPSQAAQID